MKILLLVVLCTVKTSLGFQENIINVDQLFKIYSLQSTNVSNGCRRQADYYYESLKEGNLWAIKMLDASAKIGAGLIPENYLNLGSYDECVQISKETQHDVIFGQYCLVDFNIPHLVYEDVYKEYILNKRIFGSFKIMESSSSENSLNPTTKWGFCIPNECSLVDLTLHLQNILGEMNFTVNVDSIDCQLESSIEFPLDGFDLFITILFVFIGLVVLASTTAEFVLIYIRHEISVPKWFLFSWLTNIKELFSVSQNPNQITCINGIKVISLFWLICTSEYLAVYNVAYVSNFQDILETSNKYLQILFSPFIGLDDVFFLISGCLLMFHTLYEYENTKKVNFLKIYLKKFIRLVAPIFPLILISVSILDNMGSGPFWKDFISPRVTDCQENWWATLFFLEEFTGSEVLCIKYSWFLTSIMHLYCLSPILLYPIFRWSFLAPYILLLTIAGSTVFQIFVVDFWEVDIGNFGIENLNPSFGFKIFHNPFYTRIAVWSCGLLLGYALHKRRKETFKNSYFSKYLKSLFWVITTLCIIVPFIMHLPVITESYEYQRSFNDVFLGIYKLLWSWGISWIIFACAQGYGGVINLFLSQPFFEILGKLTYSMFLTHYFIILMKYGVYRYPVYWSHMNMFYNIISTVILTVIVSIIWYLTFEIPLVKISKKKLK